LTFGFLGTLGLVSRVKVVGGSTALLLSSILRAISPQSLRWLGARPA